MKNTENLAYLSWEKIAQMYPDKWVIMGDCLEGKGYAPQGGVLLAIENDQETALLTATQNTWQTNMKNFRVVYTGAMAIPEDTVLSLSYLSHTK
jgi:hypothetical protein